MERPVRRRRARIAAGSIAVVLSAAGALAGCMTARVQSPADHSGPSAIVADTTRTTASMVRYADSFTPVAVSASLGAGGGVVTTPRFALHVPPGALSASTTFTLVEQNYRGMEITIEPSGLVFAIPATLTFNYAGTSADPASPVYVADGVLSAAWFDPNASQWTAIGGHDDPSATRWSVALGHLSYYALAK